LKNTQQSHRVAESQIGSSEFFSNKRFDETLTDDSATKIVRNWQNSVFGDIWDGDSR